MANEIVELRESLNSLMRKHVPIQSIIAEVKSVDLANKTCDILPFGADEKALMEGVRLQAKVNDEGKEGILIVPSIGSDVIVALLGNDKAEAYLSLCTEIDSITIEGQDGFKVMIDVKNKQVSIDSNSTIFNGGNLGGLVIAPKLTTELQKINAFMQLLLGVLSVPVAEPGNGSPSVLQAALKTALSAAQIPDYSNIQNNKIKH